MLSLVKQLTLDRPCARILENVSRDPLAAGSGDQLQTLHNIVGLPVLDTEFDGGELTGVVRLGAPEDFATAHLPGLLSRFTRSHPHVVLEVTCELTLRLVERFDAGGLDLALVKRDPAHARFGLGIWREPLVWIGAAGTRPDPDDPISLAVSPAPCVYRKRALDALSAAGRPARVSYVCASLAGTLAAVRTGLGVTVLPKEMAPPDLDVLNPESSGLPVLEDSEMALIEAAQLNPAGLRLKDAILKDLAHPERRDAWGTLPMLSKTI